MNNDIIEDAKEAGFLVESNGSVWSSKLDMADLITPELTKFAALRDARKSKPVAWLCSYGKGLNTYVVDSLDKMEVGHEAVPLYTSPQPQKSEPVGWMIWWDDREWLLTQDREDYDIAIKNKMPIHNLYTSPQPDTVKDALEEAAKMCVEKIADKELAQFISDKIRNLIEVK